MDEIKEAYLKFRAKVLHGEIQVNEKTSDVMNEMDAALGFPAYV